MSALCSPAFPDTIASVDMSERNFFAELKRRNVYKVAVAYAVVGWLLIQVATQVFPFFAIPNWAVRLVVLCIVLGFPVALILAWAFEITPQGIKRTEDVDVRATRRAKNRTWLYVIVIGAMLSLGLFFAGRYTAPRTHSAEGEPAGATPFSANKSIAVLPFVNMSSDKENEYFVDGLTEEILNRLAQITALKVPGRTSSFAFKDKNTDLRQVGAALGVANVLEGSVRKAGDRLRITAQLIRTIDGYHLWSQAYDRKLDDVFAIQEEIARAIADALSIQLKISADGKEAAPTQDMAAYASYLEARALISQRYMLRASALLEGAVQRDPTFAKAWAALAQTRALGMTYGLASREESRTGAETAARKALAIDDSIGLAHSALAGVLSSREQWLESEREYRRALELSPGEAETHNQYAQMLLSVGRLDAALEHAKRACELDPLAWVPPCIATLIEVSRNDLEQASGWLERSKKLGGPTNVLVLRLELVYALARRDTARARQVVVAARSEESSSPGAKEVIDILDQLISESAVAKPARDYKPALEAATAPGAVDLANDIATIFSFANRPQIALDILIAEMQSTYGNPQWIWTPPLSPIRKDPRFLELVTTLKLPDYWRVAGWPTFCHAKGDTDFECSDR